MSIANLERVVQILTKSCPYYSHRIQLSFEPTRPSENLWFWRDNDLTVLDKFALYTLYKYKPFHRKLSCNITQPFSSLYGFSGFAQTVQYPPLS